MKRYTSRFLKLTALFYMAFPATYLVLAALLFDIPGRGCVSILLSPSYFLISLAGALTGWGLWEMRRWSWYSFLLVNVLASYENAIVVNQYGETHHKIGAFAFSVLLLGCLMYRVAREVRVPYFFPKIRWWESDPRYRLSVPVGISRDEGDPEEGEIMDLSLSGCFVKLRSEMKADEPVNLSFQAYGEKVQCRAIVVWRTQSTVTHPKGIGLKFSAMHRPDRRALRVIVRRLRKIAYFYRRSRYLMNQEEFNQRLDELEGRKQGSGATHSQAQPPEPLPANQP